MSSISELEYKLSALRNTLNDNTSKIASLKESTLTQIDEIYKKASEKLLQDRRDIEDESLDKLCDNYN